MNIQSFLIDYVGSTAETDEIREKGESLAKLSRLEMCGKISKVVYDPFTGKAKKRTMYCHQWRQCPICARIRRDDLHEKLEILHRDRESGYNLYVLHNKHLTGILRRINREDYVRLPIEDDKFVLICKPVQYIDERAAQTASFHDITLDMFADEIYKTPERKRISGSLGPFAPEEEEKPEEYETIQVSAIEINTTDPNDLRAIEQAVLDSESKKERVFHDGIELQDAIIVREHRLIYFANSLGFYARVTHTEKRFVPLDVLKNGVKWGKRLE